MQITEQIIQRIARQVFNQMFPSSLRQSGAIISGSGGSVQYAAEAGHAASADSATYATSAGSATSATNATNATNASNVPWSGISSKPDTATRWPAWSEVTSKPSFASVATSGSYADLSNKPTIPTPSGTNTGYAANSDYAVYSGTVYGRYTANGGQQNPNYFGTNRVGFLMMNTTVNSNSHYKDWMIMDCYSGNDVGGAVAIGVNRQALGAYIMRSAAARESWAESAELLGTHNYSSYALPKSASATQSLTNSVASAWGWTFTNNNGGSTKSIVDISHAGGYGMHVRGYTTSASVYVAQFYNNDGEVLGIYGDKSIKAYGLLSITNYDNTVTIGSQNAQWCHIYNSANIPFVFNKSVHTMGAFLPYTDGGSNLGSSTLYFNTAYVRAINTGSNRYWRGNSAYGINMANSDIVGLNSIYFNDVSDSYEEAIAFPRAAVSGVVKYDTFRAAEGVFYFGFNDGAEYITMNGGMIKLERPDNSSSIIRAKNTNGSISLDSSTNRGIYDDTGGGWLIGTDGTKSFLMRGNVGIGTASPSFKLHVVGGIYATGSVAQLSDIREKNIETFAWRPALEEIASAPIARYTMKDDETHRMRVGSIAQYWKQVISEAVNEDENGTLSMDYATISLVSVISLAREVRQLRAEVIRLKNLSR